MLGAEQTDADKQMKASVSSQAYHVALNWAQPSPFSANNAVVIGPETTE